VKREGVDRFDLAPRPGQVSIYAWRACCLILTLQPRSVAQEKQRGEIPWTYAPVEREIGIEPTGAERATMQNLCWWLWYG
jgi:hypothetical protein